MHDFMLREQQSVWQGLDDFFKAGSSYNFCSIHSIFKLFAKAFFFFLNTIV